jgi:hypothetical protein
MVLLTFTALVQRPSALSVLARITPFAQHQQHRVCNNGMPMPVNKAWTASLPVVPADARAKLEGREAALSTLEADKAAACDAAAAAAKAQAEADEQQTEMVGPTLGDVPTPVSRLYCTALHPSCRACCA